MQRMRSSRTPTDGAPLRRKRRGISTPQRLRARLPVLGQAWRFLRRKFDGEPHHGRVLVGQTQEPGAAGFDQPGEGRDGPRQEPPVMRLDPGPVVAHEPGERSPRRAPSISSRARLDLPAPAGPRIRTPPSPMRTQPAWTVAAASAMDFAPAGAG